MGMNLHRIHNTGCGPLFFGGLSAGTLTTLALDSAYSGDAGSQAGDAYMSYFFPEDNTTITDIWVNVASYSASFHHTNKLINVELRELSTTLGKPSTTLVTNGSLTIDLTAEPTGWVKGTFSTPPSVTPLKCYAICVGDSDGAAEVANTSGFVTMNISIASQRGIPSSSRGYSTSDGWQNVTAQAAAILIAAKSGGLVFGNCLTTMTARGSSSAEYGMRFKLDRPCILIGFSVQLGYNTVLDAGTWKLYAEATAPAGTTLATWTPDVCNDGNYSGCVFLHSGS
jgi:hypothetical protein